MFLGRHLLPSVAQPAPPMHRLAGMDMEAAEKNLAQNDQAQRLPKADHWQPK
jgi:hypothetical protein